MSELEFRRAIQQLEATGDFRVLRRLAIGDPLPSSADTKIAAILDVETSGLDVERHKIIELAIRRIRFDENGAITKIDKVRSWREDPGEPLAPEIVKLTGLTDAELFGQTIDTDEATTLLQSASVVVAHNAVFDRGFVERRLPAIKGAAWACSCKEVDWQARGFDGRALGFLLMQCGWYHGAHRAGADIDAVIAILQHKSDAGPTALRELINTASTPGFLISASGAHFDCKDQLKSRGYRWNEGARVWQKEVREAEREAELLWLGSNVYAPEFRPRAAAPDLKAVTWRERHL